MAGTKAVTKFHASVTGLSGGGRPKGMSSKSNRAGLTFPVGRVSSTMKKSTKYRVGSGGTCFVYPSYNTVCSVTLSVFFL